MTIDLCFASYNSLKWLEGCLAALAGADYDKKQLGLYFCDNASADGTVETLGRLKEQYAGVFGAFEVIQNENNLGFGTASNTAARAGSGELVFFCNLDTEIHPDAFTELEKMVALSDGKVGGFELRQFPYEHPKFYNPQNLEVSWCSGACFVLRRSVFEETGGFDESFFMYEEDVELSWRVRSLGYTLRYVPAAVITHHAYTAAGEVKPMQLAGGLVGNLALRYKYGTKDQITQWLDHLAMQQDLLDSDPEIGRMAGEFMARVKKNKRRYRQFYRSQIKNNKHFKPIFIGTNYEFTREGAFYENRLPKTSPRFSVLVRTYKRPATLAMTLESLRWQTYRNFEVVVVEDGAQPTAGAVCEAAQEFLDLRYIAPAKQVGRCVAGNLAIEAAKGDYLCFLDDDDYFYPEQLEVMACLIEDNPDCRLFSAGSLEMDITDLNADGTAWKVSGLVNIARAPITKAKICLHNPVTIQSMVFHKSLPEAAGGLDPAYDALEDWDLWLRYSQYSDIASVKKVTSLFKVVDEEEARAARDVSMSKYKPILYRDIKRYSFEMTAQDIAALNWSPDMEAPGCEDQSVEMKRYEMKSTMAQTVREMEHSGAWRVSAPFRGIARGLYRISLWCTNHLGDFMMWLGPKAPDTRDATPEEMSGFICRYRRSASVRAVGAIKGLFRRGS